MIGKKIFITQASKTLLALNSRMVLHWAIYSDLIGQKEDLTYRREVVRLETSDDFFLRFFSKPSEPTKLQKQELIENS